MSSILLSNPFVTSPPPPTQPSAGPDNGNAQSNAAVAPAQDTGGAGASGQSTSHSGSGSGQSGGSGTESQQALLAAKVRTSLTDRPANATGTSVVNAQTSESAEQTARARAIETQTDARAAALIDSIATEPVLPDIPAPATRDMPDPLPTSPFLKQISDRA